MGRYGGSEEDFKAQQARLSAMADKLAAIEAKEAQAAAAMNDLGAATDKATSRRQVLNRAKKESADITAREEATAGQEAAAIDLDTQAIERNRVARERRAAVARAEQINVQRAFRGAQDPLFAQATTSGAQSQYALRQQLGIGQGRAQRLQEALKAPFVAPGNPGASTPYTQAQAGQIALTRAERELAQANRALTTLRNREAEATDQEIAAAQSRQATAQQGVAAAKQELQSIEQLVAARRDAAIALQREAEAAVVQVTQVPGSGKGTAIIQHPTAYGASGRNVPTSDRVESGITPGVEATRADALAAVAAEENRAAVASAKRAAAVAAEESALAGLTAGERAYISTLDASTAKTVASDALKNRSRAGLAKSQISEAAALNAGSVQREGAAFSSVNQEMQKHGALTQEFVLAASRGEVTLRELGNQALVTAGKFGGWTAAATAVFGVAKALGDVVKGATQAQSAQANLARFIPGQTQDQTSSGLVQVSREVNAPIEDVSQTQQVFARVFKNQADSLTATSTALKAYKLDQIDAADSTRYFTSISQEFGLQANQLPGLFDQISAAQRRMGARVAETLPAIARSAAAVKNAGGDLTQLVALTATAQVASGQTGNVVGTAFSRAASNFSRKPANQKVIESFGIDASQGFTQMLIDSVRRSQTLSGAQRTELAKAIGGPQYGGRVFQSLLGQQDRLTKAQDIVNPLNAAGSANEELHKKLQGVDEMVKRLGTDLQQLGVELAQTGAFNFAGVLLKGSDQLLHVVTLLIGEFNKIPQPLREGLSVLGEMAVAVRLLQRFAPASLLQSSVGRAIGGPELGLRQKTLRGLRGTSAELTNLAERTQLNSVRATAAEDRARIQAERAATENDQLYARAAAGDAEAAVALQKSDVRVIEANATYERARLKASGAQQDAADASLQAATADRTYADARKLTTAELKALSVYAPNELGTPNQEGVTRNSDGRPRVGPTGLVIPPGQTQLPGLESDAEKLGAQEAAVVEGHAARMQGAITAYSARMQGALGGLGRSGKLLGTGVGVVESAANTAVRTTEAVGQKIVGAGASLKNLGSSLGPLDKALIGFIALEALNSAMDGINKNVEDASKALDDFHPSDSTAAANRLRQQASSLQGNGVSDALQRINDVANPLNTFSTISGEISGTYERPEDKRRRIQQENRQAQQSDALVRRLQAQHEAAGTAVPLQTYPELQQRIDTDAKLRQQGVISQREFDHRMALHAIEAKTLIDPSRADVEAAQQALADANLRSPGKGYAQSLKGLTGKQLTQQATAISDQLSDLGPNKTLLSHLAQVYQRQVTYYSGNSSTGIAALSAARQAYYKAITDSVQAELKLDTGAGSTESERQSAYSRAASEYRTKILGHARGSRDSIAARLKHAEAAQKAASDALASSGPDNPFGLAGLGELPGQHSNALKEAADAAKKRVNHLKGGLKRANDEVTAAEHEYRTLISDLRDSRFQDRQSSRQTDLALLQSQSPNDPVKQAREAVDEAQRQVADAKRTYGAGTDPYKQAVTALNNARNGIAQAIKSNASDIINAETSLAQAQTTDPLAQARIAESGARRLLGVARTHLERLQAQTSLAQAQQQVQDAIKAQNDANFTLLESLTTDPIKQADLERQRTKSDIKGTSGANRLTAKADYNKAIQAERDARLSGREETIDFEQTMGKITIQDAVNRYQDLLKIRNLTKQQRRDIQLKIHELQSQSESEASGFNLDVGSLKLPTAYDIRRAFDPIRRQVHASQRAVLGAADSQAADITSNVSHLHDMRSNMVANIKVVVNDPNAAGKVYEALDKAMGTSVRARMRSRGLR